MKNGRRCFTLIEILFALNILIIGTMGILQIHKQNAAFLKRLDSYTEVFSDIRKFVCSQELKFDEADPRKLKSAVVRSTDVNVFGKPLKGLKEITLKVKTRYGDKLEVNYYVKTK